MGLWKFDKVTGKWEASGKLAEFLDWFSDPDREGTIRGWCNANGVAEETVKAWRRDVRFKLALERRYIEYNLSPERLQAVVAAMYDRAILHQDVRAADWVLKYVSRFDTIANRAREIAAELDAPIDAAVEEMSDDELFAELREIERGLDG